MDGSSKKPLNSVKSLLCAWRQLWLYLTSAWGASVISSYVTMMHVMMFGFCLCTGLKVTREVCLFRTPHAANWQLLDAIWVRSTRLLPKLCVTLGVTEVLESIQLLLDERCDFYGNNENNTKTIVVFPYLRFSFFSDCSFAFMPTVLTVSAVSCTCIPGRKL